MPCARRQFGVIRPRQAEWARQAEPGGPSRVYRTLNMIPYRHIAIEGPVGVGKTALARKLAEHCQLRLCADPARGNPFLTRFYQNMSHHALATQLYCLRERASAARERCAESEPSACVSDFLFDKDALFARLTLDADELALYESLRPALLPAELPQPDLVVYLQAPTEMLSRRIAARGELAFPDGYLKRIDAAYSEFFMQYEAAPVVMVNTERLDFVDKPEDFELLLRCISEAKGQRSYFNVAV